MGEIPILTIFIVSPPYAHTSDFLQCIRCFVNLTSLDLKHTYNVHHKYLNTRFVITKR